MVTKHVIPVPFMQDDQVYLYSTVLNDCPVLFDTGPDTDQARDYLRESLDLDSLRYVFITHCHPDHCGQAPFLAEESAAEVVISKHDLQRYQLQQGRLAAMRGILEPCGFPDDQIQRIQGYLKKFDDKTPLPEKYLVLEESADLLAVLNLNYRRLPGHSQSDIVYLFDNYAVTGDVVLSNIFTTPLLNADYQDLERRYNNYAAYCDTIVRLRELDGRTLLTSHRESLQSTDTAVLFYVSKLVSRAKEVAPHLRKGKSLYQVLVSLFGHQLDSTIFFFLKISELFFISDFLDNPQCLIESLKELGLYDHIKADFEEFV